MPLPLFGDSRDWMGLRSRLSVYALWYPQSPPNTLLTVRGYGRAVRMPLKAAEAFLRDHDFVEADHIQLRATRHRDGTESITREWWGPHSSTARTVTRIDTNRTNEP